MNHKFLPHTNEEIRQMLDRIGFKDLDKLYSEIPEESLFKGEYDIPNAMSELEIRAFLINSVKKMIYLPASPVVEFMIIIAQVQSQIS